MDGSCAGGVQENTAFGVDSDERPLENTRGGPNESFTDLEHILCNEDPGIDDDDDISVRLPPLSEEGVDGDWPIAGGGQDNAAIGVDMAECLLGGPDGQVESSLVDKDVPRGLVTHESKRCHTTSTCVRADDGAVHGAKSTSVTLKYHEPDSASKTTTLGRMIAIPDEENQGQFVEATAMYRFHGGTGEKEGPRDGDFVSVLFRDNRVGQYPASKYSEYRESWCENALKGGCRV